MVHTKQLIAHKWALHFARNSPGMAMTDAVACLRDCVALYKGKISGVEFYGKTGHAPHTLRKGQR